VHTALPSYNESMESGTPKSETEIEALARMVKAGFDRMDGGFEEMRAGFSKTDERFKAVDKRIDNLSYKVDQLDGKVEKYHQETKTDLAAIRGVIGGISHTLGDHEERLKALEGD